MIDLSNEKLDKMIQLLEEILKWVRLEGAQRAKDTLSGLLKTDTEKLVYESSDGRTSREIAQIVGTSHATVSNYWRKWARYGIVKETGTRGGGTRFQKVFSLSDFGIEVSQTISREKIVPSKETVTEKAVVNEKSKEEVLE
jgi:DNA-binding CsgD family transcriptional regulator